MFMFDTRDDLFNKESKSSQITANIQAIVIDEHWPRLAQNEECYITSCEFLNDLWIILCFPDVRTRMKE